MFKIYFCVLLVFLLGCGTTNEDCEFGWCKPGEVERCECEDGKKGYRSCWDAKYNVMGEYGRWDSCKCLKKKEKVCLQTEKSYIFHYALLEGENCLSYYPESYKSVIKIKKDHSIVYCGEQYAEVIAQYYDHQFNEEIIITFVSYTTKNRVIGFRNFIVSSMETGEMCVRTYNFHAVPWE